MEGRRQSTFTAPAFAALASFQPAPASSAQYFPAGYKKRERHEKKRGGKKRRKGRHVVTVAVPPAQPAVIAVPPNPAQIAPLRCTWPHPAVVELVVQQCWPVAGAAALAAPLALQQLGHQPASWWNRMLPSLSLLHPPLSELQHRALRATSCSGAVHNSLPGVQMQTLPLPQPNVLLGYEDDWLEVAPQVLPLWQATPLTPFAGPKPLLSYLVCPMQQLPQAQQFVKDVGSAYENCNLGGHLPASSTAQQGTRLECGSETSVAVYVACPLERAEDHVAALLEAASCLAPCSALGQGAGLALLPGTDSDMDLAALAPSEPQAPDRPAGASPVADGSRGPGSSLPADAQTHAAGYEQQSAQQQYHGAAHGLHQQQRGDYRQLPVQAVQRAPNSRPLSIVLQVVTPQALADISGTATRCTALSLYSKAQCRPVLEQQQLTGPELAADAAAPTLPLCSQPLMVLANAAALPHRQDVQQQQQQQQQQDQRQSTGLCSTEGQTDASRALHCFYVLPPRGTSLLALAFTDSCGELLHAEVLDIAAACLSSLSSTDSLLNAAVGEAAGLPVTRACRLVLRRSLELFSTLRAASNPPGLLSSLVIAGRVMGREERLAWRQLLEQDPTLPELPPGAEVAALELQALPPRRYAGPDPPSGCKLLLQRGSGEGGGTSASVAWLPPREAASSLLPHEHDSVRIVQVTPVARCTSDVAAGADARCQEGNLVEVAGELHGLAWLNAAYQGAGLRTAAGGGQAALPDAHLPIHAAMAERLHALLVATTQALA
ncbi:Mediator of RNA polymerase II transcription subunit 13-like [Chlorella vulgaris]